MSQYFGTFALASGEKTTVDIGAGGLQGVILGNESGFTVTVAFDGTGQSRSLYPGTVDFFAIPSQRFNGNIFLTPVANLSNVSSWPGSYIQIDVVGINEQITGVYPFSLVRNTNVGNAVNTVGGGSLYVQNDGNTAGTSIVESTVTGDSASAVAITNDGSLSLGTTNHYGQFTLVGSAGNVTIGQNGALTVNDRINANLLIATSGNDITLTPDATNRVVDHIGTTDVFEVNSSGAELLSGTLTVGEGTSIVANLISAQASNDIGLHVASGQHVVDTVNGVNIFEVGSGGPTLLSGVLSLLAGSISHIYYGSGGGSATITHNMGVVPTVCFVCYAGNFGTAPTQSPAWYGATTTQVSVHAQGGYSWVIICIA